MVDISLSYCKKTVLMTDMYVLKKSAFLKTEKSASLLLPYYLSHCYSTAWDRL